MRDEVGDGALHLFLDALHHESGIRKTEEQEGR